MIDLTHVRMLMLVGDDYEDLELWYPTLRLREAGAHVTVAGQKMGHTYRGKHGYPCTSDADLPEMEARDFHGIVIPGGWMPDKLRRDAKVLQLVGDFDEAGKLIASICHGPWIDISAGIVKGCRYTSTPGIKDDLINAGAKWSDEPLVIDRHHVTSRRPDDLPHFCKGILQVLEAQVGQPV